MSLRGDQVRDEMGRTVERRRAVMAEQSADNLSRELGEALERERVLGVEYTAALRLLEAAMLHVYWPHITRTPAGKLVDKLARRVLARRLAQEFLAADRSAKKLPDSSPSGSPDAGSTPA